MNMQLVVDLMIYLGIVLMLNNIIGILILFFLGYFGVVLYGKPDIIIASVLSEIVK